MKLISKRKIISLANRKIVLKILHDSDGLSISELARKVNFSKPTLMKIMNYYEDMDLVFIAGKGNSTVEGGKKPNIFKFNKEGGYAVSIIISYNKLYSIIANLNCEIINQVILDLKENEEFEEVFSKILKSYNYLLENTEIDRKKVIGLALGTYGITDYYSGEVIFSPHFSSWGKNIKLKQRLKENIKEDIPIYIDNFIRFKVFAEKVFGQGKGKKNIISLEVEKGLSAGVIIENRIKRGNHSLFGAVGHMIIDPEEKEICACGRRGCFETKVSIDRIIRLAKENYNKYPDSLIFENNPPEKIDIYDIFDASNNGDALAIQLMDEVIKWFNIGLSNIIIMYDPKTIIIHGIYSKAGKYFLDKLREEINRISLLSFQRKIEFKYSNIDDKAGVMGGASYVLSNFFS